MRKMVFETEAQLLLMKRLCDGRHATFAEVALELVAVGENGGEPGGNLGHGPIRWD